MFYVIGLGNPEKKYDGTRHNVGFEMLDALREAGGFSEWADDKYAEAKRSVGVLGGAQVELLQPQTYMNKSGITAKYLIEKQGASPDQLVVVYDDVDLPVGDLKISVNRGAGGHNGVQSIINNIGKDFIRIRVGVAKKGLFGGDSKRPQGHAMSKHVLGKFSFFEKLLLFFS